MPSCINCNLPGQVYHRNTLDVEWRCGKCGTEFTTAQSESHQAAIRSEIAKQKQKEHQEYLDRVKEQNRLFLIATNEWDKQLKEMYGEQKVEKERQLNNPRFCPPDFHIRLTPGETPFPDRATWLGGHRFPLGDKGDKYAEHFLRDAADRKQKESYPEPRKKKKLWPFG